MASRKAQMFVATAVFLTGLLFVVQQALVIYSVLDMTTPFTVKDSYSINNVLEMVNYTIISQQDTGNPIADCLEFENDLKELLFFIEDDFSKRGYLMMSDYSLECTYWNNNPAFPAPLNITVIFIGDFESYGIFKFHHNA